MSFFTNSKFGHFTMLSLSQPCETLQGWGWIRNGLVEINCLCGLVVRVPGCRSGGPSSIPGATRFFWEVEILERGPLGLVSSIEELLEREGSGSGLEIQEYGSRDPSCWPRGTLYPENVGTKPTSGDRYVGIVRSRSKTTEVFYFYFLF
jgi:hypothetical protein